MDIEVKAVKLPRELIRTISDNPRVIKAFEQLQQLSIDILPEKIMTGIGNLDSKFDGLKKQVSDDVASMVDKVNDTAEGLITANNKLDVINAEVAKLTQSLADQTAAFDAINTYLPPVALPFFPPIYLEGV